jgi:lambda family phage portal protein
MPRTKKALPKRIKSLNGNGQIGQARAQMVPEGGLTQSGQPGRNPGGYGASGAAWTTNATKGWAAQAGSPDSDIVLNLDLLRSRSRELYMGNPVAAAAINTQRIYCVGVGIKPLPKINGQRLGMTETAANDFDERWAEEWELWAGTNYFCDWNGRYNFYQLQDLCLANMLLNGDCPVLLPFEDDKFSPYSLKIRMIEADRLQNPIYYNYQRNILGGVELDRNGKLVSYHVRQVHPHQSFWPSDIVEKLFEWVEIPARGEETGRPNLLLVHEPERCEQRRGVPILGKVIEILKQLDRFIKAEVSGAEMAARFIAQVKSQFPNESFLQNLCDEETRRDLFSLSRYDINLDDASKAVFMRPGDQLDFYHTTRPNQQFDPFVIAVCKLIGAATGVPYEILLSAFSQSYSASKAAFLLFEKRINVVRNLIVTLFCQPVYAELMAEAVERGIIQAPGFFDDIRIRQAYTRCEWIGTPLGSIDPQKDLAASKEKVILGASTCEREAAELTGTHVRHNVAQQKEEVKMFHDAGLPYPAVDTPITRTMRIEDISDQPEGTAKSPNLNPT